jgi:hypothetical protein
MAFDSQLHALKPHWRRLAAAALAVLAAGFLLPVVVPQPTLHENRKLATLPPPPHDLAQLRAWPKSMDSYVSDNFPARKQLIAGLNYLRFRLGVSGTERVIIGRDGWLYYDNGTHFGAARNDPPYSDDQARAWLQGLAGRTEWLQARGVRHLLLMPSDKEFILPQHGPGWYKGPDPNRPAALLLRLNAIAQAGDIVYPAAVLQQQARWGLNVYNPVETHWTGLGAYAGYVAVMQRLAADGLTDGPRPLDSFREVTDDPFKPRNLVQMLGIASFVDADYPQFVDPALTPKTRFPTEKTDWTALQVIDTGAVGKPVLLMVRDSFSLALLPFLEPHFSRIVLAHHQDGVWRPELIERFKPDVVIFEVIESGAQYVMSGSPPASDAAKARIERALAAPHRMIPPPTRPQPVPPVNRIDGTAGADTIRGTRAGDAINGLAGNDRIEGLGGDDVLRGGRGDDQVLGGKGQDWVTGDLGNDTLSGGPGADLFRIAPGGGTDVVTDFQAAEGDRVELAPGAGYAVRQVGGDTVIELEGARLILRGVRARDLPADFIVVR